MEQNNKARRIGLGILFGMLSGITVIALTYIAGQLVRLPFPPFSLFDSMTRTLPGAVVTAMIDLLVTLSTRLNLGPTAETAKLAEQSIALLQFVLLGGALGAILGAMLHRRLPVLGLSLGLLLGMAFAGVEAYLGFPTVGAVGSIAWIIIVFGGWGLALGGCFRPRCWLTARRPARVFPGGRRFTWAAARWWPPSRPQWDWGC